jgi:hypothetical protein
MIYNEIFGLATIISCYIFAFIAAFFLNRLFARYTSIKEFMHEEASTCRALYNLVQQYKMPPEKREAIRTQLLAFLDRVVMDWSFRGEDEEQQFAQLYNRVEALEVEDRKQSAMFGNMLTLLHTLEHVRSNIAGLHEAKLRATHWALLCSLATALLVVFDLHMYHIYDAFLFSVVPIVLWLIVLAILGLGRLQSIKKRDMIDHFFSGFPIFFIIVIVYFVVGLAITAFRGGSSLPLVVGSISSLIIITLFDPNYLQLGVERISTRIYEDARHYIKTKVK